MAGSVRAANRYVADTHALYWFEIDRAVPEMHDRMIGGVARRMSLPLLTRDASIVASNLVAIVW